MNYYAFAMPIKGGMIHATLSTREFLRLIEERREKFSWEEALRHQNLFDSHDTDRFPSMIVNRNRPYFAKEDAFGYDGDLWAGSTEKPYLIRKPTPEERKLQRMLTLFQVTYPGAPYLYYGTEVGMWSADDPDDRMPWYGLILLLSPKKLALPDNRRVTMTSILMPPFTPFTGRPSPCGVSIRNLSMAPCGYWKDPIAPRLSPGYGMEPASTSGLQP